MRGRRNAGVRVRGEVVVVVAVKVVRAAATYVFGVAKWQQYQQLADWPFGKAQLKVSGWVRMRQSST